MPFYSVSNLLVLANSCKESVFAWLLAQAKIGNRSRLPMQERKARITISRMIKHVGGVTNGTALPADFRELICAINADGIYIPKAITIRQAQSMANTAKERIWAVNGVFLVSGRSGHLTNHTVYYYATPNSVIAYNDTVLSDFPDVFYNTLVSYIALEAILSEALDVKTRYASIQAIFMKQVSSLK